MERFAELVLVTPDGAVQGCLPPILVSTPWWNDAEAIVRAVREHHGIDVTILRLLSGQEMAGASHVIYLAETISKCTRIQPWRGSLDDHPLRHSFARCGGPAADLTWAEERLVENGYKRSAPAIQVRTWNLSSLWKIPTYSETLWLKVVPPFFAHEGAVLNLLAGRNVPAVLGYENGRMLLKEVTGADLYNGATRPQFFTMISSLVDIQASFLGREDELLKLGLPDWRLAALGTGLDTILSHVQTELPAADFATLKELRDHFSGMILAIESCGLPCTMIHGDFHPGNVRGSGLDLTLLDWSDSGIGHPLLDETALLRHVGATDRSMVYDHWHEAWRKAVPGSNPGRASQLLKPLAAIHQAIIRQRFIDNIEPAEHFYHLPKRASWLKRAAELYRSVAL